MWTLFIANSSQARIRDFTQSGALVIDDESGQPLWAGVSPTSLAMLALYREGFHYAVPNVIEQVKQHRIRPGDVEKFRLHLPILLAEAGHIVTVSHNTGPVPSALHLNHDLTEGDGSAFETLPMKELILG